MDEIEPARAEPEVAGGDVDHDLVAGLRRPDQRDVAHGRAPLAVELDLEALQRAGGVAGRHDDAAPQAQHRAAASSTRARVTSSMPSRAATLTRSPGSWLRSVPLARFTHSKPAALNALASEPPPVSM